MSEVFFAAGGNSSIRVEESGDLLVFTVKEHWAGGGDAVKALTLDECEELSSAIDSFVIRERGTLSRSNRL